MTDGGSSRQFQRCSSTAGTGENYPGAKTQPGVGQQIISLMPPHRFYVEPFLGTGAIFRKKQPASIASIVADLDEGLVSRAARARRPGTFYLVADAFKLLPSLDLTRQDLVYVDPPYHPDTRTKKRVYRHELTTDQHSALLAMLQELRCNVILSGYRCPAYDTALASWHRLDYRTMTRGGPRIESAWCNFEPGLKLHDSRFVGANFRERERIKRKRARWVSRLLAMPPAERAVIAGALELANLAASGGEDRTARADDGARSTRSLIASLGERIRRAPARIVAGAGVGRP